MNLLRGVKLKKTLAKNREASSEIYVPQYFKRKMKNVYHSIQYFLSIELDICICSHRWVAESWAAKFDVRK